MAVTDVAILSTVSPGRHRANLKETPLLLDKDARPFARKGVVVSEADFAPGDLAITSKYVLTGQLRFMIEDLFPKMIERGIDPFGVSGAYNLRVFYDNQPARDVGFAAPVTEVLENADGSKLTAVADGMMRYTTAWRMSLRHPDFTLRCATIDQTALPQQERLPFYAIPNERREVVPVQTVPAWGSRKDYVSADGTLLNTQGLSVAETDEVKQTIYGRYRVYPDGETMPRGEGEDFGPGFDSQASMAAALDRLYDGVQRLRGLQGTAERDTARL